MSGWGGGFNRSSNVAASERSALLVRAQVGEPRNPRGYLGRRSPFVFLIPSAGFAGIAGFLAPETAVRRALPRSVVWLVA